MLFEVNKEAMVFENELQRIERIKHFVPFVREQAKNFLLSLFYEDVLLSDLEVERKKERKKELMLITTNSFPV